MQKHGQRTDRKLPAIAIVITSPLLLITACVDPVQDQAISALGPEDPAVPPGPNHRPGQPCLLCHTDGGKAQAFSLAGTIYLNRGSSKAVGGVDVMIFDSQNVIFNLTSNCAGNFFVRPEAFTPRYPIWVSLGDGSVVRDMDSAAYREGSCAGCHADPISAHSAGHVYLVEDPTVETPPPDPCSP